MKSIRLNDSNTWQCDQKSFKCSQSSFPNRRNYSDEKQCSINCNFFNFLPTNITEQIIKNYVAPKSGLDLNITNRYFNRSPAIANKMDEAFLLKLSQNYNVENIDRLVVNENYHSTFVLNMNQIEQILIKNNKRITPTTLEELNEILIENFATILELLSLSLVKHQQLIKNDEILFWQDFKSFFKVINLFTEQLISKSKFTSISRLYNLMKKYIDAKIFWIQSIPENYRFIKEINFFRKLKNILLTNIYVFIDYLLNNCLFDMEENEQNEQNDRKYVFDEIDDQISIKEQFNLILLRVDKYPFINLLDKEKLNCMLIIILQLIDPDVITDYKKSKDILIDIVIKYIIFVVQNKDILFINEDLESQLYSIFDNFYLINATMKKYFPLIIKDNDIWEPFFKFFNLWDYSQDQISIDNIEKLPSSHIKFWKYFLVYLFTLDYTLTNLLLKRKPNIESIVYIRELFKKIDQIFDIYNEPALKIWIKMKHYDDFDLFDNYNNYVTTGEINYFKSMIPRLQELSNMKSKYYSYHINMDWVNNLIYKIEVNALD